MSGFYHRAWSGESWAQTVIEALSEGMVIAASEKLLTMAPDALSSVSRTGHASGEWHRGSCVHHTIRQMLDSRGSGCHAGLTRCCPQSEV